MTPEEFVSDLHDRARTPLDVDISDYGDEWCAGFIQGQINALAVVWRWMDLHYEDALARASITDEDDDR